MYSITTRTASLLARMPGWFATQAVKTQQDRQAVADRRCALEFLCGVEAAESDFGEWQDTVAAFNQR